MSKYIQLYFDLKIEFYKNSMKPKMSNCTICNEQGGEFVKLDCPLKHSCHSACIEAWLENNSTCPSCKMMLKHKIVSIDEFFRLFDIEYNDAEKYTKEEYEGFIGYINDFPLYWKIKFVEEFPHLFKFIVDKTEELCKIAVVKDGSALRIVPTELKTPELCRLAVENDRSAIESVPDELRTPELCYLAMEKDGWMLFYVPEKLKTPEMCRLAVENCGWALQYVPDQLKTPEMCISAMKNAPVFRFVPKELRTQEICKLVYEPLLKYPEMCRLAVEKNGLGLQLIPEDLKTPELCRLAVENNGLALEFVPNSLKTHELCNIAIRNNRLASLFLPEYVKFLHLTILTGIGAALTKIVSLIYFSF